MEDIQLYDIPEGKVYKTGHMMLATLFGGLFVGAYLLAENFKTLGNRRAAAITWVITVLYFIFIMIAPFFMPQFAAIPSFLYVLLFALLTTWAGRHFQLKRINIHLDMGGTMYSGNRVVAITIIGLAIMLGFSLMLFFIQDTLIGRF